MNVGNSGLVDSHYKLKELYPSSQFDDNKSIATQFYLVHNQFEKNQTFITTKLNKKALERKGPYDLTALHVAAIKGNENAVKILVEKEVEATQDRHGWTALHHAVVGGHKKIKNLLLKAYPELADVKDSNGLTAQDLEKRLTLPSPSSLSFKYKKSKESPVTVKSGEFFQQQTGAALTDRLVSSPDVLVKKWRPVSSPPTDSSFIDLLQKALSFSSPSSLPLPSSQTSTAPLDPIHQYFSECYPLFKQMPPPVYMSPISKGEHGLFAEEDIPPYVIIADYLGQEIIPSIHEDDSYVLKSINAKTIRNLGPLINDGFPNVETCSIIDPNTREKVTIIYTTRQIAAGEQFLMHYGPQHSIKLKAHQEFALDELRQAFRETSLTERYQQLVKLITEMDKNHLQDNLELETARLKLSYLFHTPSAFLTLIYEGIISIDKVDQLLLGGFEETYQLVLYETKQWDTKLSLHNLVGYFEQYKATHSIYRLMVQSLKRCEKVIQEKAGNHVNDGGEQGTFKSDFYQFLKELMQGKQVRPILLVNNWLSNKPEEVAQLDKLSVKQKWLEIAEHTNRLFELLDVKVTSNNQKRYDEEVAKLLKKLPEESRMECLETLIAVAQIHAHDRVLRLELIKERLM
ncbi:ankyrin repeat domain-containing protein [Candidatus Protochlamydia phocaeensis]|uniref:ankyrin repeat domain-containing protein n=1 Tax=Candidatus Protochlamydia phocaeensis TaxID=1414722 RepID=UPI0008399774|nr:ankyrin repeat domain-containing protein [Candidatus Protochlamydia phocaeensis]